MKSDTPPRLATVLLQILAPREEALTGDLQEEFRSGRSQGWYWWQVGAAIAFEAWRDLRHQKLPALGAIAVALSVYFALAISGAAILNDVDRALTPHVPRWMLDYFVYQMLASILWTLVASWAIGVLIMALNRNHGTVALVALVLFVTLVEFPTWTLLPWLSMSEGLGAQIVIHQTTVMMVKIAGLVAGSMAFPPHAKDRVLPPLSARRSTR